MIYRSGIAIISLKSAGNGFPDNTKMLAADFNVGNLKMRRD